MRHRLRGRKLGRRTGARLSLLRGQATALFDRERIRTTLPKAKELRPYAERLITLSRRDNLHARRTVLRIITDRKVVGKLFDTLAPRFAERPGGYTRILKLGPRRGDNAEMAILELIGSEDKLTRKKKFQKKEKEKASKKKKKAAEEPSAAAAG